MNKQCFPQHLPLIKSFVIRDHRGVEYETKTVLAPALIINGLVLTAIPTLLLSYKRPVAAEVNYLGNDLLKRFYM